MRTILALLMLAGIAASLEVHATSLPAIADTYVDNAKATVNFGGSGIIAVSSTRTALIRFDPASIAASDGDLAILNLKVLLAKNFTDAISVRLVTGPWNEKTVNGRTLPPLASSALDFRTIQYSEQGTTVQLDLSAALSGWRRNPSSNHGIAITAGTPVPNLQLGARETRAAATLDIGTAAVLRVTTVHDGFAQGAPAINNDGEIVYWQFKYRPSEGDPGTYIYSTRRGLIAPPNINRQFPDINDAGEVVWGDCCSAPTGWALYSSQRGRLGPGSIPRISREGRVVASPVGATGDQLGIYERDGTITPVNVDPAAQPFTLLTVNLSEEFGVAYTALDASFNRQLFFSNQGQITHFGGPPQSSRAIAANDLGEWVYIERPDFEGNGTLFTSAHKALWNSAAGLPQMNEMGDIAFAELVKPPPSKNFIALQVLLATKRPFKFIREDRFKYLGVNP